MGSAGGIESIGEEVNTAPIRQGLNRQDGEVGNEVVPAVPGDQHLGRPLHTALLEGSDCAEPSPVAITLR